MLSSLSATTYCRAPLNLVSMNRFLSNRRHNFDVARTVSIVIASKPIVHLSCVFTERPMFGWRITTITLFSSSPCLSRTSYSRSQLLLNVSEPFFVTLLKSFLANLEPPKPQNVHNRGYRNCYDEKDVQVRRGHRFAWSRIEVEHVVHAEEAL